MEFHKLIKLCAVEIGKKRGIKWIFQIIEHKNVNNVFQLFTDNNWQRVSIYPSALH
mgnify:CR=1 FL=1